MSKTAIVVGHPRTGTFCQALAENYAAGVRKAGNQAEVFVLSEMQFDPILHEGFAKEQPLEADLQAAHDAMLAAEHLVIVFPLWMGGMPALLKGFIERVFQPDFIKPYREHRFVRLLKHKSVRIIVTMGMPAFVYRWWFKAHEIKILERNIFRAVGCSPVRVNMFGSIDGSAGRRRRVLRKAMRLGAVAA